MTPRYTHVGRTVWRDAGTPEEYVVGVCATEQDARDDVAARNAYEPSRLRIGRDGATNPERDVVAAARCDAYARGYLAAEEDAKKRIAALTAERDQYRHRSIGANQRLADAGFDT